MWKRWWAWNLNATVETESCRTRSDRMALACIACIATRLQRPKECPAATRSGAGRAAPWLAGPYCRSGRAYRSGLPPWCLRRPGPQCQLGVRTIELDVVHKWSARGGACTSQVLPAQLRHVVQQQHQRLCSHLLGSREALLVFVSTSKQQGPDSDPLRPFATRLNPPMAPSTDICPIFKTCDNLFVHDGSSKLFKFSSYP